MKYDFNLKDRNITFNESFTFKCEFVITLSDELKVDVELEFFARNMDNFFFLTEMNFGGFVVSNFASDATGNLTQGILMGYFNIFCERRMYKACTDLKHTLNGEYVQNNYTDLWADFTNQLMGYYNKSIKPRVDEQFNIFKKQ